MTTASQRFDADAIAAASVQANASAGADTCIAASWKRSPSHAASAPLPTSIATTPSAKRQPSVRRALVPPALPLPCSRMSMLRKRPSSRLPETEPSR